MSIYSRTSIKSRGTGGGGGAIVSGEQSDFLNNWSYDEENRLAIFNGSIEVLPSTFYMGKFSLSNGVQAVAFTLADGIRALGLVNRFDPTLGSISNPKFFALGAQITLPLNTVSSDVISDGFTLQYTTIGNNLSFDFDFIPATAGTLKTQYWIGTDDTGNNFFDEQRIVTQAEVDAGVPIPFGVGNPYLLEQGTAIFARCSGIDVKGDSVTGFPYFVTKVLPYKEITINGHVEHVTANVNPIYVGCDYAVDASGGAITITVPANFDSKFRVYDYNSSFSDANNCIIDFSAFGVGTVNMRNVDDDIEFFMVNGAWWLNDIKGNNRSIV